MASKIKGPWLKTDPYSLFGVVDAEEVLEGSFEDQFISAETQELKLEQRVLLVLCCSFLSYELGISEVENVKLGAPQLKFLPMRVFCCFYVSEEMQQFKGRIEMERRLGKQKAEIMSICSGRRKQQVLLTLAQDLLLSSE